MTTADVSDVAGASGLAPERRPPDDVSVIHRSAPSTSTRAVSWCTKYMRASLR